MDRPRRVEVGSKTGFAEIEPMAPLTATDLLEELRSELREFGARLAVTLAHELRHLLLRLPVEHPAAESGLRTQGRAEASPLCVLLGVRLPAAAAAADAASRRPGTGQSGILRQVSGRRRSVERQRIYGEGIYGEDVAEVRDDHRPSKPLSHGPPAPVAHQLHLPWACKEEEVPEQESTDVRDFNSPRVVCAEHLPRAIEKRMSSKTTETSTDSPDQGEASLARASRIPGSKAMTPGFFGHRRSSASMYFDEGDAVEDVPEVAVLDEASQFVLFRVLNTVVNDAKFDYASGLVILCNAASIGWQTDYNARNLTDDVPPVFRVFDILFCILFSSELGIRLLAYGRKFFRGGDLWWNLFDLFMVAMQIFEEFTTLAAANSDSGEKVSVTGGTSFAFLRLLRILRLVRIVRLVRVLRMVRQLRTLVCSIFSSLQSLLWTLVLVGLMNYIVGVYFVQLVTSQGGGDERLHKYFGSVGASLLSLFEVMTGGINWDEIAQPLMGISPLMAIVLAMYVAFAVLAMLNVITGVFVESALQTTTKNNESEFVGRMREFYSVADSDKNGMISWTEFQAQLTNPLAMDYFQAIGLEMSEARDLFELLDVDESGEVESEEFVMGCLRLRGPAKAIDLATLMYDHMRTSRKVQMLLVDMLHKVELLQEELTSRQPQVEEKPKTPEKPDAKPFEENPKTPSLGYGKHYYKAPPIYDPCWIDDV